MSGDPRAEAARLVGDLRRRLEAEVRSGRDAVPRPGPRPRSRAEKLRLLDEARKTVALCQLCVLAKTRTNTVYGEGSPDARLMFIGEGPGADEDAQGRPFVGRAGQLLNKIIEAAGLKREDVYIANIVKCRPPENRVPEREEIDACRAYLDAQIDVIRPRVICTLGSPATKTLLDTNEGINALRGRLFDYRGFRLIPTFHPAYLLRNPAEKGKTWADIKKVLAEMAKAE